MAQQPGNGDAAGYDPVRFSKLLSFLLRHRPDALALELSAAGWVEVDLLIERINASGKLPFPIDRDQLETLLERNSRFQLRDGRIRARTGHSVRIKAPPRQEEAGDPVPEFLFAEVDDADLPDEGLLAHAESLLLVEEEPDHAEAAGTLAVVEAARARRAGVAFERAPGGFRVRELPTRYVISLRRGYERQISAGGVLVRGRGAEAQFALIRTRPRDQAQANEPEEFEDPRGDSDRRGNDRRRAGQAALPPAEGDRRQGSRRGSGRRRRSGRWARDGRLELPKGKLEPGETPEQAAVREVREELGIAQALEVLGRLSYNNYVFRTPEGRPIFKTVHYYLLRCDDFEPSFEPALDEGIVGVEWWSGRRAIAQVAFANLRPVLEQAWRLVQ